MGRRPGRVLRVRDRPRRRRADGHPEPADRTPRAGRRGRRDHAVERADPDQPRQGRPGARRRLHGGAQAGAGHPVAGLRARAGWSPSTPTSRRACFNVVTPRSNEVAAVLTTDPRVDMVSFTGSTATGRAIMAAAAPTLKKVFLELGGKSAAIALDDADVASVAGATAFAACIHAGQGCAITTRLRRPAREVRRGRPGRRGDDGVDRGQGPGRPGRDLRPGDLGRSSATGSRPTCGSPSRGGRHLRHRRPRHRPGRLLGRADRRRRPRQLLAGWRRRRSSGRCSS